MQDAAFAGAPSGPARWRERWLTWRARIVARPGFQRWAAGFPPTRAIARRNTRALFDLCAGFVYAQILFACVELDLFSLLGAGPRTLADLARRFDMPVERARRLLDAAAALGLVHRLAGERYVLADLGAAMIGNPGIGAMVAHHAMLYADLADPVALLRGRADATALSRYWLYADHDRLGAADDGRVAGYSALMAASQALIAEDILETGALRGRACLMDVGGGEGRFLIAAARRHPALRLMLFDLPAVARRAQAHLAAAGLAERARCVGGSFHGDALPQGADAITLVRILHDHDDAAAQALLRAVRDALPDGGRVLVAEPMAGTKGADPIGDAYFGFYLLAMGSGRARSATELRAMLARAGFTNIREARTRRPLLVRLLTADRPTQV